MGSPVVPGEGLHSGASILTRHLTSPVELPSVPPDDVARVTRASGAGRDPRAFRPLVVGALYPGIERGLAADVLAARALGGEALVVCTVHVIAGHGRVTDVLEVPSDTVAAQLEHLAETRTPTAVKVGIAGGAASVGRIGRYLASLDAGVPVVLDVTLSGPSGEDIAEGGVREALVGLFPSATVVTIRRADAELVCGMEIPTLDDAQVAVQRLHRLGARRVLLRCGRLAPSAFDASAEPDETMRDLYFDGDDFALFETPAVAAPALHGASSLLTLALARGLADGMPVVAAIQEAERLTADALRHAADASVPDYFGAVAAPTSGTAPSPS